VSDDSNAYWNPASPKFLHLLSRSALTGSAANGAITEFSYDGNANPTQERRWDSTRGANQLSSFQFDGYGNLTQVTDPAGNVTQYAYDGNNLYLSKKVQGAGSPVARTFNYAGDFNSGVITSKTDADNSITTAYG
jgi:YD repeat-containing protein